MKYEESNKCVVRLGVKDSTIYVLIRLKKIDGKYRIFHENKSTYFECLPETEAF